MIKLSIIVPVFGVEDYVGKTMESVFDTTASAEDFEVIVVNDGTKDGSMDVVRQYAGRPNITIIEQENQGLSAARMNGWAIARGKYVWFIDSDDYLVEDGVGKVLERLADHQDAEVLMFPIIRKKGEEVRQDYQIDAETRMAGIKIVQTPHLPEWSAVRFVLKRSLKENPWVFFPRNLIHEDNYFGIVLLYVVRAVWVMPDPVYVHQIRPGSIMTSLTQRSSHDMVSIHRLLKRFMKEAVDPSERAWLRDHSFKMLMYCDNRFPLSGWDKHGLYLWNAWREVYPSSSWKTKIKRLLYFMMPDRFGRYHC